MAMWKKALGTVAPMLATALGGPLAGMAVTAIGSAIGLSGDEQTEENIAKLLSKPTDEMLLALQKANTDFEIRMKELEINIMKLNNDEKDSARRREVEAKDSLTPRVLAASACLLFFACIVGSFWIILQSVEMNTDAAYLLGTLTGGAGMLVKTVYDYYFGSTQGSSDKNVLLFNSKPEK